MIEKSVIRPASFQSVGLGKWECDEVTLAVKVISEKNVVEKES